MMDEEEFTGELGIQVEGIACAATAAIERAGLGDREAAAALFVYLLLGWVFPTAAPQCVTRSVLFGADVPLMFVT